MVYLLSQDTTSRFILFRRQLPPSMLLVDHILRFNFFLLQHLVQRREAILEALYRVSEGFWFSPVELVMTSLFHFEDKVHHRNLTRAESIPLLFSRLLRQILEHIGFPIEPRLERRRDYDTVLTVDRWKIMPCSYHLPPPDPAKDQSEVDLPTEKQPALAVHIEEPQLAASSVPTPAITASFPTASASYVLPKPSTPSTTTPKDVSGPSTTSPPPQHISIST